MSATMAANTARPGAVAETGGANLKGIVGSIATEVFVLRKRVSTWVLLGVWVALAGFFAYILPYVTYRNERGDPGAEPLDALLPANFVAAVSGGFPFFGGAIALMLGVLSVGSEFGWGTWKTLLTQRPGRLTVFGAKLAALAIALIPFVVLTYAVGAIGSAVIAQQEDAAITWPAIWEITRGMLAGWLVLATWTALGVMLATLTRGTSLAIGIGILYALVVEGLLSALGGVIDVLEPFVEIFLRANAYSLVEAVGVSRDDMSQNGPGAFDGPFVGWVQAVVVLLVYCGIFTGISAWALRRRDVA
jgi:ABC-2 type transport system permease protein